MTAKMAMIWVAVLYTANKKCDISFEDEATAKISFDSSDYNLIPFDNCLSDSYAEYGPPPQNKNPDPIKWFCQKWDIPLHEMSHPKTIPECSLCALTKVHSSIVVFKKIIF
jgi:hypothetical protein